MNDEERKEEQPFLSGDLSRRDFLKGAGSGVVATSLVTPAGYVIAGTGETVPMLGPEEVSISLSVNGVKRNLTVEPRVTLLNALRNHLDITGPKPICERGECGGCTVLVDGKPHVSCLMLAIEAQGNEVTTIEGLAQGDKLDPLQEAFIEKDALMCGFCTPGFIMSLKGFLDDHPNPTKDQVKNAVAGNTCRCGTYPHIVEAALEAAKQKRGD